MTETSCNEETKKETKKETNKETNKEFYSKLTKLMFPIAFQELMLAAVAAADSFMLGRLDQISMAAVSLATQIQFVQNMIFFAIMSAAIILGAQYWGKKDRVAINNIFCHILRITGVVSVVFCAACEIFPGQLMRLFTNEQEMISIGASYLRIAGWSYLITGVIQSYLSVMKITEHAKESSIISSAAVLINIFINAVLIFGLFGFSRMGADGAAIATLISRIIELGMVIGISLSKTFGRTFVRPSISGLFHRNKVLAKDFTKCVLPLIGGSMLWTIGFTVYTSVMGHLGSDAAAANAVAAVVRDLMCCLCAGMASAGGIIVGNELGAGRLDVGRMYGRKLVIMSVIGGLICCIIVLAVTVPVVRFMDLTDNAEGYLSQMMIVMAFYMIARTFSQVVINGIFAAGGDTIFDMYSLVTCMWGVAIPLAVLGGFVFDWPVVAVYACTCVDEMIKIPWEIAHYRKYKWVKDLTRESY